MAENITQGRPQTAVEKLADAENMCADLSAALRRAGVTLPSLRVEAIAYGDKDPHPLIELGRCNLDTAGKLAAVLRRAAQP